MAADRAPALRRRDEGILGYNGAVLLFANTEYVVTYTLRLDMQ